MKKAKRGILIAAVAVFVGAAAYLNWSYNKNDMAAMAEAEDAAMAAAQSETEATDAELTALIGDSLEAAEEMAETSDYFAQARLTRQQSRDEALGLLNQAAASEAASQEIIDSAMDEIAVMANYSMQEAQIENMLLAKDFADCVVFMSADGITAAVPAPEEGLSEADVARVTDVITAETGMEASCIKIIEVK